MQNESKELIITMLRQKYVPDLSRFMSCCEINYVKFLKLLPGDYEFDRLQFASAKMNLIVDRIDITPHTLTVLVTKQLDIGLDDMPAPSMEVRIYFDAKLAEVTKYQGLSNIKPIYPYPNKKMMQRNEKQQANEFLGEWLTFCLSQGYFNDRSKRVLPQDLS